MKKAIIVAVCVVVAISALLFSACTGGGVTVDQAWASNESLSYSMYDSEVNGGTTKVGSVNMVTTTNLTADEKGAYPKADTKVTVSLTRDGVCTLDTTFYTRVQNVISLKRTYVDLQNCENDYVLNARHDGKNYVYDITYPSASDKNASGKINVGNANYTDNEFIYFYIRCYDVASVPSSIKIADPFNNTAYEVGCTYQSDSATVTVETDKFGTNVISANSVTVSRNENPVGSGLTVYYLPEKSDYSYGGLSLIKSVKLPVKIVENNISYVLNDFSASK